MRENMDIYQQQMMMQGMEQQQQQQPYGGGGGVNDMRFDGVEHSKLVQRRIKKPVEAGSAFQTGGAEIPIVLVPRWPLLFHFALNVPSGVYVLHQRWMKDQGQLQAGVKWFWPAYNRISHVITRQAITYCAPTYSIPTADNIMVNINLMLTFRIGPDFEGARDFVYRLGAQRLDELLSAKVDESIRGLVYTVTHDRVNDLREEFAGDMLQALNSVLSEFGVQIQYVKITDVQLPYLLQHRLERTTGYKTKIEEQEKAHENKIRVLNDVAEQDITTLRKANARRIQELEAAIMRFEIEKHEMEEGEKGQARVKETEARARCEVKLRRAEGDEEASKINAQREAEARVRRAEIECDMVRADADRKAEVAILASEAKKASAEAAAKANIATAEAELAAIKNLAEKRKFELEWKRLDVLKLLAAKGRRFITGKNGNSILGDLVPKKVDEDVLDGKTSIFA